MGVLWGKAERHTSDMEAKVDILDILVKPGECRVTAAIRRQAAIDEIRAFVAEPYQRYVEAYNGYDRANDLELVDSVGKLDHQAISDIRLECIRTMAERGVTLVGDEEDEVVADWSIHDNSDGSGERVRMVCEPAILWHSRTYGWMCIQKAYTIAA